LPLQRFSIFPTRLLGLVGCICLDTTVTGFESHFGGDNAWN
jgi:hypothetical protein